MTQPTLIAPRLLTKLLHVSVTALLVGVPLVSLGLAYVALTDPEVLLTQVPHAHLTAPPGFMATFWALVMLLPALIAGLVALKEMRALFGRYLRGDALSHACARHIRRIGAALLIAALTAVIGQVLGTMILSFGNLPGQRVLALSISSWQIGVVLIAGFLTLIGHVMAEAARIADENRGFV